MPVLTSCGYWRGCGMVMPEGKAYFFLLAAERSCSSDTVSSGDVSSVVVVEDGSAWFRAGRVVVSERWAPSVNLLRDA